MTKSELVRVWGKRHGVCRDCAKETWYFNERRFRPQGTGVVFDAGRAAKLFTLWKPDGWATPEHLALGAQGGRVGAVYGELDSRSCGRYTALVFSRDLADGVFYVYHGDLWGFGLVRSGLSPCV